MIILEFFVEIIFRGLIVHFFGLYTRYYFFKFIGKNKPLKYLSGEKQVYDSTDLIQQPIFNAVIGIIVFSCLGFLFVYLSFGVFNLS